MISTENYGNNKKTPGSSGARHDKQLPTLKQKAGESDYKFLRRVNTETRNAHEEANFEAKYGVEVVHDEKTGAIKLKKRPRNEIDERIKQNLENHKRTKRGQKMEPNKVMAPEEKKKLVKQAMAEKKEKEREEAKSKEVVEFKRDEFKFGEVVMAPPTLSVPRRAKKAETVPRVRNCFAGSYWQLVVKPSRYFFSNFFTNFRNCTISSLFFSFPTTQPGQKPLLLHSVIENFSDPKEEEKIIDKVAPSAIQKASNKATTSLKGKRKEMSMAMRHMIEKEQSNVIEMYKQLKKSQREQSKNKE